jgi:spore maturation protein CgeB
MKFLFLNRDYTDFLEWLYAVNQGLEGRSYDEQLRVRNDSLFGVADFYSSNLRDIGEEAYELHINNEYLQRAWANQHGIEAPNRSGIQSVRKLSSIPVFKSILSPVRRLLAWERSSWFYKILASQIRHYRPDVLINQDLFGLSSQFLHEVKPYVRLMVGQHAATPFTRTDVLHCYDLMISSFPPTVECFRKQGVNAELNRMGFEPRVLSGLRQAAPLRDVSFIGSFQTIHRSRQVFFEQLCARLNASTTFEIWAPTLAEIPPKSPLRQCYRGPIWGREMYHILNSSRITLNHHGDVLPFANNMRLFEATGVGTLLVTDWKENLVDMFDVGKEVITYRTPEECAEVIKYYLAHEDERNKVAQAGHARTLREHTYRQRVRQLIEIVGRYL